LQQRCCKQEQHIVELRKELALEETSQKQWSTMLDDAMARIAASEVKLGSTAKNQLLIAGVTVEGRYLDVASRVRQAESLNNSIRSNMVIRNRNAVQLDQKKALQCQELESLKHLQELVWSEEATLKMTKQRMGTTESAIAQLEHDRSTELVVLEETMEEVRQQNQKEKTRLCQTRDELNSEMEFNRDLEDQIMQRTNRWLCWRRSSSCVDDAVKADEAVITVVAGKAALSQQKAKIPFR